MGVIELVVLVPGVGGDGLLINARLANRADQVLDIPTALYELFGQTVEQPGNAGRIAGPDVVDRLDDSDPEQVTPNAIRIALGVVGIVLRCNPVSQLLAPAGGSGCQVGVGVGEGLGCHGARPFMPDVALALIV